MRVDEYALALLAAVGVLLFGVLGGILLAILVSVGVLLWQLNHPPIVRLGRDPETGAYRDLAKHPGLETVPRLLVVRIDARLYFANARRVTARVLEIAIAEAPPPTVLLVDAASSSDTDVTAAEAIEELHDALEARGIEFWGADLLGRSRELAERRGRWGEARGRVFPTIDAGFEAFRQRPAAS